MTRHLTARNLTPDDRIAIECEVMRSGCGAVVSFAGIVRADQRLGGRRVAALMYEAYAEMAERQLRTLVVQARAQWSLDAAQIQHRVGVVHVGQISVLIAVAAQHRAEAYAACQFLIEQIKHEVPIWKQERYSDGTSEWVACGEDLDAYV